MSNLNVLEIKSFVPAQDFTTSKQFYLSLGFELITEFGDVAYLRLGQCAFYCKTPISAHIKGIL